MHGEKVHKHTTTTSTTTRQEVHKEPNRLHASVTGLVGGIQSSIGRMTKSPATVISGERKKVAARAEADLAKLHTAQKVTNAATHMSKSTSGSKR